MVKTQRTDQPVKCKIFICVCSSQLSRTHNTLRRARKGGLITWRIHVPKIEDFKRFPRILRDFLEGPKDFYSDIPRLEDFFSLTQLPVSNPSQWPLKIPKNLNFLFLLKKGQFNRWQNLEVSSRSLEPQYDPQHVMRMLPIIKYSRVQ